MSSPGAFGVRRRAEDFRGDLPGAQTGGRGAGRRGEDLPLHRALRRLLLLVVPIPPCGFEAANAAT